MDSVISLVCVLLTSVTCATTFSDTFQAMTTLNGQVACAEDDPTEVHWMSHISLTECGIKCLITNGCTAFNMNELTGKCGIYTTIPQNLSAVPGCNGYIMEG